MIADVEGVTIPQCSYQPIPLLVSRTDGTKPIRFKLLGAPSGLTLTAHSEKEVRLSASDSLPVGQYTVQLVAETADGPTLVRTQPLIDRQLMNADLIPLALREDQRHVPFSLGDRLAIQITPPSPFRMELPESMVTLARYQRADFPIQISRTAGFDGSITFSANGGQLADPSEGRTRVYSVLPPATAKDARVTGSIHSKILSNLGKTRVDVSGVAVHNGRHVTLNRTFELNLTTAFSVLAEPLATPVTSGQTIRCRLKITRVKSFTGEVNIHFTPHQALRLPDRLTAVKGQEAIDFDIRVADDAVPGRHDFRIVATALVDGFEEEVAASVTGPEVRQPVVPKKK